MKYMMKTDIYDKERKLTLRRELREYIAAANPLSGEERKDLYEWVASGHSVHTNPYLLCDESGYTMDFIEGVRVGNDLCADPSNYIWGESVSVS
jgi:hypothetical protein